MLTMQAHISMAEVANPGNTLTASDRPNSHGFYRTALEKAAYLADLRQVDCGLHGVLPSPVQKVTVCVLDLSSVALFLLHMQAVL